MREVIQWASLLRRKGGHGDPVVNEVRSSGAANDVVVCGELAIFRQFSGGLLSSVI